MIERKNQSAQTQSVANTQARGSSGGSSGPSQRQAAMGASYSDQAAALAPGSGGFEQQAAALAPVHLKPASAGAGRPDDAIAAEGMRGAPSALPHRGAMERAFGVGLGGVKAHTGPEARQASAQMGAEAYAVGNSVAFASPNPTQHTVAHELAHVFQQGGVGGVEGVQKKGGRTRDAMEDEADAVADRVASGGSAADIIPAGTAARAVQRKPSEEKQKAEATAKVTKKLPQVQARTASQMMKKNQWKPMILPRKGVLWMHAERKGRTTALENFIAQYNDAAVPMAGAHAARGRMDTMAAAGINIDNPAQYAAEFDKLGTAAEQDPYAKLLRGQVTNGPDISKALGTMRAAQAELRIARQALQKQRLLAEKALKLAKKKGLTDKIAGIKAKIQAITQTIATIESITAKLASAYASAGASLTIVNGTPPTETVDLSSRGQAAVAGIQRKGQAATAAGLPIPTPSAIVGWIAEAHYAPEIKALEAQIGKIDKRIGEIDGKSFELDMSMALTKVQSCTGTLDAAKAGLKQAIGSKRGRVHDLGSHLDQGRMKDSDRKSGDIDTSKGNKKEYSGKQGAGRASALLDAGQAVIEFSRFVDELMTQVAAINPGGRALMVQLLEGVGLMPNKRLEDGTWAYQPSDRTDRELIDAFGRFDGAKQLTPTQAKYKGLAASWNALLAKVIPGYKG